MKHREQSAPPYSEAQATAWLAWLARGMQQHGQTLFLIEQLQPSWLSTRRQRWVYILTSRLTWGVVVAGLILMLVFRLFMDEPDGGDLIPGLITALMILIYGLTIGLFGGLIDIVRFTRNHSQWAQTASATLRQIIAGSLLFGLIGGLIGGLLFGLIGDPGAQPAFGLVFGLSFGPFWMHRSFGRNSQNEIQTVETIRFSWAHVPKGIVNGLISGLIIGLIGGLLVGLLVGLSFGHFSDLTYFLIIGLKVGLVAGLIGGLISCFRSGIQELKSVPNQGIQLTLRTASLMGGVGGLGLGLIVGLLLGWPYSLAYGALGGLCIGLWYGGLDVIQHYLVRLLLWRAGAMPRNYARFLDYAAEELTFLQKVGGGYIFVHRYLLEYFAAMELPGQPVAADEDTAPQPMVTTGESA